MAKSNRLSGISSLTYTGTNAQMPPNMFYFDRAPGQNDTNFALGDFWIHRKSSTQNDSDLYVLMGLAGGIADWDLITSGAGTVITLTGDTGGAVPSDGAGNINTIGDGTITVAGNPGTNTLTWSAPGLGVVYTVQTTDAVQTVIFSHVLTDNTVVVIDGFIVMGQDDYSTGFFGSFSGSARKPGAGLSVLIGSPILNFSHDVTGTPNIDIALDGNSLELLVQGIAATTFNWRATIAISIENT